ncbi:MAG: phosphate--acyl-ACP acyltransferase, partial [Desulfuromusa sp.]|nr:phosphate--acyl-ACP acyltransferase [Desulfuromusa sp.]
MSVKIAVDAMGGDNSPAAEVAGAGAACQRWGCKVVLVGDTEQIQTELEKHQPHDLNLEI